MNKKLPSIIGYELIWFVLEGGQLKKKTKRFNDLPSASEAHYTYTNDPKVYRAKVVAVRNYQ